MVYDRANPFPASDSRHLVDSRFAAGQVAPPYSSRATGELGVAISWSPLNAGNNPAGLLLLRTTSPIHGMGSLVLSSVVVVVGVVGGVVVGMCASHP